MLPRYPGSFTALVLSVACAASALPADDDAPPGLVAALKGHKEAVYSVAFTADGKHVVTGSGDPSVKVWDAATGAEIKTYAGPNGHRGLVLGVALSPGGTHFATAGADNSARVWDYPDSRPARAFALRAEGQAVAVSPDGARVAGAGKDGTIRVWAAADGKPLHELSGHSGSVTGVAFSPNGQLLASVGSDSTLRFWNAGDGKPAAAFAAHPGAATGVAFHPNGSAVLTCGPDGTVRHWALPPAGTRPLQAPFKDPVTAISLSPDGAQVAAASGKAVRLAAVANGQTLKEFDAGSPVTSVAVSPGGAFVAAGTGDRDVLLWQTKDGQLLMRRAAHAGAVTGVAFAPGGGQLATVGKDGLLRLFAVPAAPPRVVAHPDLVRGATLSPDGKRLATAGADKSIRLYRLDNLRSPERQLTGHAGAVGALAFSGDGKALVSGGSRGLLRFWSVEKGEQTAVLGAHEAEVTSLARVGDRVLSTSADGSVKLWQAPAAGRGVFAHAGEVTSAVLSPDGARLITGCGDKQVRGWNAATGQLERTWTGPTLGVLSVAVGPKGDRVAAGAADKSLHVWEAASNKLVRKLDGLPGAVHALAMTPDGKLAVAGLSDGSVRLYDLASGKEERALSGHQGAVNALLLTAKGDQVISGGADGVVQVRPLTGGMPARLWKHDGAVHALALSRDGARVAVGGADKQVRLYALSDGKAEATIATPAGVRGVALSADGKRVAVAGADGRARVYALTGALEEYFARDGAVNAVSFPAHGRQLFTAGADKTARAWTLALLWQGRHESAARQAVVSPRGDRVYSAGDDGMVRLWGFAGGKPAGAHRVHDGAVTGLSLSSDGTRLVTAGADKAAHLWDVAKLTAAGKPVVSMTLVGVPTSVSLSPNGQKVAVGVRVADRERVQVFDAATGRELLALDEPALALRYLPDSRTLLAAGGKEARLVDVNVLAAFAAHPGGCAVVAFHDNGTQGLTGGADGSLKLWSLPAGKLERSFGPLAAGVDSLALARGGAQVAATSGKTLKVWNTAGGREALALEMPAAARSVAFSGDRTRVATAGEDARVRVWDVAERREQQGFLHAAAVTGVAFPPFAANQLLSSSADRTVGVHTLSSIRATAVGSPVTGVAVSPTTGQALAACADGKLRVLNAATGAVERTLHAGDKAVTSVAVSRNGVLIAAGTADRKVRLFTANDGRPLAAFTAPAEPRALAFSANSQALVVTAADGSVTARDVAYSPGQPPPAEFGKVAQSYQQGGGATGVAFPTAGSVFYTSGADGSVNAWRLASETPLRNFGHPDTVNAIAYNKEGTLLATGCGDGRLRLFDPAKGALVREINAHPLPNNEGAVYAVAFSPDGKRVASGSKDGSVKLFHVADGKLVREFKAFKEKESPKGHHDAVLCLAFSPDGKQLASGGADRAIKVWNVADGALAAEMANPAFKGASHPGWVYALRFADGGKKLLSAGGAPRLRGYAAVWDVAAGKPLWAREMSVGTIFAMAASPDESLLALGTGGSVRAERDLNLGLILKMPK